MRHTDNPLAYAFAEPRAKHILYELDDAVTIPYNALREKLGLDSKTFHRVTRRMAQFNLLILRAPEGAEFEDNRIRVVLESTERGRNFARILGKLDKVVEKHRKLLGEATAKPLLA